MNFRLLPAFSLAAAGFCAASCATPMGPAYTIESQEIRVALETAPDPRIQVESVYRLRNTGNRPLASLEVRLPGRRFFRTGVAQASWDNSSLSPETSPANPRDTLFSLPKPWKLSERHTLHLSVGFLPPAGDSGLNFSSDAFFLPSQGWAPELLPARGLFGAGGVPPKRWFLSVRVPAGFLVHTSGGSAKTSRSERGITVRSVQSALDRYPFVVAGRYQETQVSAGNEKVILWARAKADPATLHQSVDSIASAVSAYDIAFGERVPSGQALWIVECPVVAGCFTAQKSSYATLLGAESEAVSSELASADTIVIDLTGNAPNLAVAAPALAASWLGYGQNPGFYEQDLPLAALPAFASALGREAVLGPSSRRETIRRALRVIGGDSGGPKSDDQTILRAKSFLFFYALQDLYGQDVFRRAINHMLSARQGRGFDLDDLIAAFDQESHQNTAEFVRLWMKRPGVPAEFRARYQESAVALHTTSKEIVP